MTETEQLLDERVQEIIAANPTVRAVVVSADTFCQLADLILRSTKRNNAQIGRSGPDG
jgi:hypothetical protein